MSAAIDSLIASTTASPSNITSTKNDAGSSDRFLKLLVAQMQNQDPLNPMDNAQITSQIAQINTVSGIDKLNRTMEAMSSSFTQSQALQGASLVGRDVVVAGNRISTNADGVRQGGFELAAPADTVRVEVLNGAGVVIDSIDLGAQSGGRHGFDWTPSPGVKPELAAGFRVVAKAGAAVVASTTLMRDRVDAVITGGERLTLELHLSGSVPYSDIKAFD